MSATPDQADGLKHGPADCRAPGHGDGRKLRAVEPAATQQATRAPRSTLETAGRAMRDISADALAALRAANEPPSVFRRSASLARVRRDEQGRPLIDVLGESELRGYLDRAADWEGAKGAVRPPLDVVRDILALGDWDGFPVLEAMIEAPALRRDGSVIDRAGYDPPSRLLHMPDAAVARISVSRRPTGAQRAAARALLDELLADFPFVDVASRAAALALLITPAVRPAISGPVPLALIDAPRAGSGKGLLVHVISRVHTGGEAAVLPTPVREEEWQKTLLAAIAAGRTLILLDEATELRSAALAATLTAATLEGRALGRTHMLRIPQRATWAAAGNNIRLGGDIPRRCFWIRLDAKVARPWKREGFRHPELLKWAEERRGDLLAAILTVARSWFAEGCPPADVSPLGGFEEWTRIVGGILQHAEVPAFLANLDQLYDATDEETIEWASFLSAIAATFAGEPFKVADLAAALEHHCVLRDALPAELAEAAEKGGGGFKIKLGKALAKRRDTRYGDEQARHLQQASRDPRSGVPTWRVRWE